MIFLSIDMLPLKLPVVAFTATTSPSLIPRLHISDLVEGSPSTILYPPYSVSSSHIALKSKAGFMIKAGIVTLRSDDSSLLGMFILDKCQQQ